MKHRPLLFTAVIAAAFVIAQSTRAADADLADLKSQIAKQHDRSVKRLQDWIKLPSIAAENRGFPEGAEHMAKLLKEVGFQRAEVIATEGKPGV